MPIQQQSHSTKVNIRHSLSGIDGGNMGREVPSYCPFCFAPLSSQHTWPQLIMSMLWLLRKKSSNRLYIMHICEKKDIAADSYCTPSRTQCSIKLWQASCAWFVRGLGHSFINQLSCCHTVFLQVLCICIPFPPYKGFAVSRIELNLRGLNVLKLYTLAIFLVILWKH